MKRQPLFRLGPKTALYVMVLCFCLVSIPLLVGSLFPYPLHASCTVEWNVTMNCHNVRMALLQEIKDVAPCNDCMSFYQVDEIGANAIKAHKIFPLRGGIVYDISLEFQGNDTCEILASSWARPWHIIFDKGTSYCNLHKLAIKSGLKWLGNFTETTCNAACTQYDMALCRVYKWWLP